jgi:glycosyltransferase involved in cell wall biosynthesis
MSGRLLKKTKILFIVPDLYSGGAQRVFMNLVRSFSRIKFDITLVTLIKPNDEHFARLLPKDIRIIQYNFLHTRQAFFPLIRLIRKEQPHVVFSTLTHLNFILAIVKKVVSSDIKFVARESNTISSSLNDEKFPWLFKFFYGRVYKTFDLIICQSRAMADDLVTNFRIPRASLKVIYNPLDVDLILGNIPKDNPLRSAGSRIELVCVGRLNPQKGFDRLLKIMALLHDFDFRLRILGDGVLKESLVKQAHDLDLDAKVQFLGIQENPFRYMAESDCLLLTSYYEGLPNVVLEANACGLPVIAFDSPGGTSEIIEVGLNGWLIKDDDLRGFADKIRSRKYLYLNKQSIVKYATDRFSFDNITTQYENAILSLKKAMDD